MPNPTPRATRGRAARGFAVPITLSIALAAALLAGCSGGDSTGGEGSGGGSGQAGQVGAARTPSALTATPSDGGPGAAPTSSPGRPSTVADGLEVPWGIAFLPGGDALVTERDSARVLRVTPAGEAAQVGVIDGVSPQGEGGLLGVAVSPTFDDDHNVFFYFTSADDNRIVRYRYDGGLSAPKVIVSGIPRGVIHNGGRLEFGPDGYLYAGTGETGQRGLAQDRSSLGGKILRMTVDGEAPPGNPFGDSLVWSYGHRNVQGLAWDPQGRMFATEFGQNTYDEINRIEKGHNYGWPEVEGVGHDDRYTDPLVTWSTAEASPSGLAYAEGSLWVAALRGERLWQVPVGADGSLGTPIARYQDEYGRLRPVERAPGGGLWVGTSNRDGRGSPRGGDDRILLVPLG